MHSVFQTPRQTAFTDAQTHPAFHTPTSSVITATGIPPVTRTQLHQVLQAKQIVLQTHFSSGMHTHTQCCRHNTASHTDASQKRETRRKETENPEFSTRRENSPARLKLLTGGRGPRERTSARSSAGREARERRGSELRRRAVRLVTSPRHSPHAPGATLLRAAQGHPGRLQQSHTRGRHTPADSQRGGDTPQADSHGHTTREHLQRDSGGDPLNGDTSRRTHEETTGRLAPTHTHTHTHTHTQAESHGHPFTGGRATVRSHPWALSSPDFCWRRKPPLGARGSLRPPSSGIFPDPARHAER